MLGSAKLKDRNTTEGGKYATEEEEERAQGRKKDREEESKKVLSPLFLRLSRGMLRCQNV